MTIWVILGFLAILCLVISVNVKRTGIWNGLIVGVLISVLVAIIMKHDAINAPVSRKIVVVCVVGNALFRLIKFLVDRKTSLKV